MTELRLHVEEIAGSVGNFGTVLPILFGVALVSDVNLGTILLFFGLFYIVMGLFYGIPMSVEPLKVVGAIVIAEGLTSGEIAASGILMGVIFLTVGLAGGMRYVQEKIPMSVIRGIQLGLALLLLETSLRFIIVDPVVAVVGVGIILVFFLAGSRWNIPDISALLVILLGIGIGVAMYGVPQVSIPQGPALLIPSLADLGVAAVRLVPPQIPLTLTNAILATSLLAHDLFRREIKPDRLSTTIGIMNLVAAPLGGFPLCHGAGGLAAHYRFGARTGMANIFGGIILFLFAVFFSNPDALTMLPQGMFGALLVFVAIELAKHGVKTDSRLVTASMAIIAVAIGMTIAFIWGLILVYALARFSRTPANART